MPASMPAHKRAEKMANVPKLFFGACFMNAYWQVLVHAEDIRIECPEYFQDIQCHKCGISGCYKK